MNKIPSGEILNFSYRFKDLPTAIAGYVGVDMEMYFASNKDYLLYIVEENTFCHSFSLTKNTNQLGIFLSKECNRL